LILKDLDVILKKFHEATVDISGEHVSLSSCIPIILALKSVLSNMDFPHENSGIIRSYIVVLEFLVEKYTNDIVSRDVVRLNTILTQDTSLYSHRIMRKTYSC